LETAVNREWVPIGAPLTQQDAEYLRDIFHRAGFPARVGYADLEPEQIIDGRGWLVWTPIEHEAEATYIREQHFSGPTRRPRKRSRLTGIFRRRAA
jgi:hypothetical protein